MTYDSARGEAWWGVYPQKCTVRSHCGVRLDATFSFVASLSICRSTHLFMRAGLYFFFNYSAFAVYRYFGQTPYFFVTIKLGLVVCIFVEPRPPGGGVSQLENYSLPTPVERTFRYFCLLWIMSDDFFRRPVSFIFPNCLSREAKLQIIVQ